MKLVGFQIVPFFYHYTTNVLPIHSNSNNVRMLVTLCLTVIFSSINSRHFFYLNKKKFLHCVLDSPFPE